jgi:DNA-directed RNA polymerase subunit M/transcription elongation factor TFIIS
VLYCRQVEEGIYSEADGRLAPYEKAIRRIAYTLRSGGRTLMNQHRARNVAGLADDTLAASTTLGRRRLTTDRRLDACRAMMADADIFEDAPAAVVRCRKCGGGDVVSNLLQTRSADEPMTIFNRCANPKCNARWRQ